MAISTKNLIYHPLTDKNFISLLHKSNRYSR